MINFNQHKAENNLEANQYKTEVYSNEKWLELKDQILNVVQGSFPEFQFKPERIESMFIKSYGDKSGNGIAVLLKEESIKKLIGFVLATVKPSTEGEEDIVANIDMIGIIPEKRGEKLVGKLMGKIEQELKNRNVKFITRNSRKKDGYADAIERHYGDRIVEKRDSINNDPADPKCFYKIRL